MHNKQLSSLIYDKISSFDKANWFLVFQIVDTEQPIDETKQNVLCGEI